MFGELGWVKVGVDFCVVFVGAGLVLLIEMCVSVMDAFTWLRFCVYWVLVGVGSSLIWCDFLWAIVGVVGG